MKVTENSTYRLMQTNLNRITTELQDLRYQGATGVKLNAPSDDPSAIRPVLTTRTQIRHTDRYLETMGVTLDKMESTDGHMEHVENILQRVKEIGINSINSAMCQQDLNTLADEISQLKDELLDASNAVIDGKYVFSGYQENTIPFVENPAYDPNRWEADNPNTWPYIYQGDANPTELEITPGEVLEVNLTGNDLFLGISNTTIQTGTPTQPPLSGIQIGTTISSPVVGDITISSTTNPPVTIVGGTITDVDDYYAQNAASQLEAASGAPPTLTASVLPSSSPSSGAFSPNTGALDDFTINGTSLVSGPISNSLTFDSRIDSYINGVADPTLAGGSIANGDAWFTDSRGNTINISGSAQSGDLSFSSSTGADLDITHTLATPTEGFANITANVTQTTYGTLDVRTNTIEDVTLAGPGLANLGLTAATLDMATAFPPDSDRMDMFSALTRLEEAIRAGNVEDLDGAGGSISQGIDNLENIANQERRIRSRLGNRASRTETAMLHQEDIKIDLQQVLSRYQDTDAIQNFNDIIKQETAFQAALSITAKISQISILDFM